MAFQASLEELQAEASCPLCLDYLRDAVTIDCGHNFCRSCLLQQWQGLQDTLPCPVCLQHCVDGKPRSNPQLGGVVDAVRRLPILRPRDRRPCCEQHGEALDWFCEEDLQLLCPQCRASCDHQDHPLCPIPQAAAQYRRKLKSYMELLNEQMEEAEGRLEKQVSKSLSMRMKMIKWRKELDSELEEFKRFLGTERVTAERRLLRKEQCVLYQLTENQRQLSGHVASLQDLVRDIREKCLRADLDLLRSLRGIDGRCKDLEAPAVASSWYLQQESCRLPPHYFGLHTMSSVFQVDLTLNPRAAHPDLQISPDRKSVKFVRKEASALPQPAPCFAAVQSEQRFASGRHFWQIEVRGPGGWTLGVCHESFCRNSWMTMQPCEDCWQIEQFTTHPGTEVPVRRTAVFLDCDLGEVSFYNWNRRSYFCTLTCKFREPLVPFFALHCSSDSLTISMVREE